MIKQFTLALIATSICACSSMRTTKTEVVAIPFEEERITVVGKDGLTQPSRYRVLYMGRKIDPNRPDIMREAHFAYQRVHPEVFDTNPGPAAIIGTDPLLGLNAPVRKAAPQKATTGDIGKVEELVADYGKTTSEAILHLHNRLETIEKRPLAPPTPPELGK